MTSAVRDQIVMRDLCISDVGACKDRRVIFDVELERDDLADSWNRREDGFDFSWRHAVAARIDDVVHAPGVSVVARFIYTKEITCEIPFPLKALCPFGLNPSVAEHQPRIASMDGKLSNLAVRA